MAEIKLGDNETLESALRRFKRKVQQEDIIREVKRHAFYVPPGEKRRLKSALGATSRFARKFPYEARSKAARVCYHNHAPRNTNALPRGRVS